MTSLFSETLREIIILKFIRDDSNRMISIVTNVGMRQLQRMKFNWIHFEKMTLFVIFIKNRSRKFNQYHELKFLNYLKNRSHVYLNEMTWFLFDEFEIVMNEITISRALKRLNWNRKKVIKQAAQRNEMLWNDWMTRLRKWIVDQLIFLNESAACERIDDRKYKWASLRIKSIQIQKLKRFKQWFILFVFIVNEYIVWKIYQDSIIVAIFNDFIENQMLFQCTFYSNNDSRSVLMMNNAKIHWSEKFIEMCKKTNVLIARLSSYFSDFNSIETSFTLLKSWIRRNDEMTAVYTNEYEEFEQFLKNAIKIQSEENSRNLFYHCEIKYLIFIRI